ncbi:MAG: hypothetical protein DIU71_15740 [Proteobacteria bacterium]|nr:MAG: hypothetical protein DIU71_15740 [Pseudomonadota bacterium]
MASTKDPSSDAGVKIARHTAVYAIGNVVRQLAGFIMLPVYTRYLTPADYGAVGLLAFALAILEPFFGARMTQAIPKFYFLEKSERSRQAVITSSLLITASVSAVTAVLICVFRDPASELLFGTTEYALATALFGLNMLTQPVEYSGMTFIRMQQRSILFLCVSLAKMCVQIALNVWLVVFLELGVLGVILSGVIASSTFGLALTLYTFYYNRPRFDSAIAWRMLKFSWPLWFAGLAGLYIGSSNRLYLRVFGSLDDVGLIELGTRFASIIGLLIWTPFSQHWDTVSYKYYSENNAARLFQGAFLIMGTLMVVAGLGISIFAEPVIQIMAAEPFHAAAGTVPFLTLGFMLNCLVGFFYFSFMVTDNTKVFGYCHYFTAAIITVCFLALIPPLREVGAAAGQCLAYAVTFVFVHRLSRKYYDPGIKLGFLFGMIGLSAAAYILSNLILAQETLMADLAVKAAVYLATCALLGAICARQVKQAYPEVYASVGAWLEQWRGRILGGRAETAT